MPVASRTLALLSLEPPPSPSACFTSALILSYFWLIPMPGRAKSDTKKAQEQRKKKDELMQKALTIYMEELEKVKRGEKGRGAVPVCKEVMDRHRLETGESIVLVPQTLLNLVKGGKTLSQFNAEKSWLLAEEVEVVISNALELTARGFPLSHKRMKEHVDEILRARLGNAFPAGGVGENWVYRFVEKNSDRLKTCWSSKLEQLRGRAVNPATNDLWHDIVEGSLEEHPDVDEDCIWATDETGFHPSLGHRERVIGAAGSKLQYQQRGGTRENITVMVTICANGTSIAPTVIFKGQAFQSKWKQENPLEAS